VTRVTKDGRESKRCFDLSPRKNLVTEDDFCVVTKIFAGDIIL
jgi:hypothetical protein